MTSNRYSVLVRGSKCPTKSEIVALGLTVGGSYSGNQLVQLSDISGYGYLEFVTKTGSYTESSDFERWSINTTISTIKGPSYQYGQKVKVPVGTEYEYTISSRMILIGKRDSPTGAWKVPEDDKDHTNTETKKGTVGVNTIEI